ncbi:hypothetical protein [Arthrobacter sp. Soil736]|uniref:hypothetical protein n=1 Tax=Arthrobacter sp. Soil736 TaxID=1736395 RepID=UPI0012F79583|nr:hypothetical protein [Arthrobacter sp. Soil736]
MLLTGWSQLRSVHDIASPGDAGTGEYGGGQGQAAAGFPGADPQPDAQELGAVPAPVFHRPQNRHRPLNRRRRRGVGGIQGCGSRRWCPGTEPAPESVPVAEASSPGRGVASMPQPVVQPAALLAGPAALIAAARVLSTASAASSCR